MNITITDHDLIIVIDHDLFIVDHGIIILIGGAQPFLYKAQPGSYIVLVTKKMLVSQFHRCNAIFRDRFSYT